MNLSTIRLAWCKNVYRLLFVCQPGPFSGIYYLLLCMCVVSFLYIERKSSPGFFLFVCLFVSHHFLFCFLFPLERFVSFSFFCRFIASQSTDCCFFFVVVYHVACSSFMFHVVYHWRTVSFSLYITCISYTLYYYYYYYYYSTRHCSICDLFCFSLLRMDWGFIVFFLSWCFPFFFLFYIDDDEEEENKKLFLFFLSLFLFRLYTCTNKTVYVYVTIFCACIYRTAATEEKEKKQEVHRLLFYSCVPSIHYFSLLYTVYVWFLHPHSISFVCVCILFFRKKVT